MTFPLTVTCPQCSARLTASKPVVRGRCKRCGVIIEFAQAANLAQAQSAKGAAIVQNDGEPQADAVAPSAAGSGIEQASGGRGRRLVKLFAGVCGLVLFGCGCVYWFALEPASGDTAVVTPVQATELPVEPGPDQREPVTPLNEGEDFDGTGEGQLDSLLLGGLYASGSWLKGLGAVADSVHATTVTSVTTLQQLHTKFAVTTVIMEPGHCFPVTDWEKYGPLSGGPGGFDYQLVKVPELHKLPVGEAEEKVKSYGLQWALQVSSIDPETDKVMTQKPEAKNGKRVKHGTIVNVTIGREVPNLIGQSIGNAVETLKSKGFQPNYDTVVDEKHIVAQQLPQEGSMQEINAQVTFFSEAKMPDVWKQPMGAAIERLESEYIAVDWPRGYDPSNWPEDVVCRQSIRAGERVLRGEVVFGRYSAPVLLPGVHVPQIVGQTGEAAQRRLDELGIRYRANVRKQVVDIQKRYLGADWGKQRRGRERLVAKPTKPQSPLLLEATASRSTSTVILAQLGGGNTIGGGDRPIGVREVFDHADELPHGPRVVTGQSRAANDILCRGDVLIVDVVQPMMRIEYFRQERIRGHGHGQGNGVGF